MDSAKTKIQRATNPRASASFLSIVTFMWTLGIFKKGYQKDLEVEDLCLPLAEHKSSNLGDDLERNWNDELKRASDKEINPSLIRVMCRTFGYQVMGFGLVLVFAEIALKVAQPLFLARFLAYFTPDSTMGKGDAYYYASAVILCSFFHVIVINPYWMGMLHLGMKMRVACCSLLYRKALKLSKSSLGQTTVGQIVNLMSNDVDRFDYFMIFMHYLWVGPVMTVVITYFLWLEIGVSAFYGVAALLVFIPTQMFFGKKKSDFRHRTAKRTDNRICLMNEIVIGIQVIKMYSWEKAFTDLVTEARRLEIREIRGSSFIQGIMLSFIIFHNRLAIFCSIVSYVLYGNIINASIVYVVTSYFTLLRQMMSDLFPMAISCGAEVLISIKRIQEFLCFNETSMLPIENEQDNYGFIRDNDDLMKCKTSDERHKQYGRNAKDISVSIRDVTAKWNDKIIENTLNNINIQFKSGKLAAVIGTVGAGKSSLLHGILKELPLQTGSICVTGIISYASQEPWLFDESVRQNILFGSPYDEMRYREVINVCALRTDFEQFPYSDKTLVGDRGNTLSGGQKARINLARAVYKRADIYLLDDPLSAVDAHVGKHLFEQCIKGFLRGKTCIIVTHQLQYLSSVDHIIFLENGSVKAEGTYHQIQSSEGGDFIKLLLNNQMEEEVNEINGRKLSFQECQGQDEGKDHTEPEKCQETKKEGTIGAQVFKTYLSGGGQSYSVVFLLFMFVLTQFIASAGDYWLNYWVNLEEYVYHKVSTITTTDEVVATRFPFYFSQTACIIGFTVLIIATIIISLARSFLFFIMCLRSSTRLHNEMFQSISRTVLRFFHTNPSGRILNRFTKDMGTVDEVLPCTLLDVLQIGLNLVGIVGLVTIVNIWLILPTIVVVLAFYLVRQLYVKTSRSIKRLDGITRSPVFSHLNASLQGLSTIRAFKAQTILQQEFDNHQDLHSAAFFLFIASTRAFGYALDLICLIFIAVITLSFVIFDNEWFGGNVGLVITQAIGLTGIFQWGMRQSAELENNLTSVERILEYCNLEKEPSLDSLPDKKPAVTWPEQGRIEFSHVYLTYSSSLPYVLKDLNFVISAKEKVGIVGRTGAGKSSLVVALFRLTATQGDIIIDDINTKNLGLHDLRSKISIIPQEPFLFSGTVRKNLDPFDEFSDHKLWNALEEVELKDVIQELPDSLNEKISEGGSNLSVGQRQLICLARAILRKNRILILDEATANVDPRMDTLIQNTIRRNLSNCTVLTIAHRLNTVMDSDKILLMDNGCLVCYKAIPKRSVYCSCVSDACNFFIFVQENENPEILKYSEFDHPYKLLCNKHGHLYKMVEETGRKAAEALHKIAEMNYQSVQMPANS